MGDATRSKAALSPVANTAHVYVFPGDRLAHLQPQPPHQCVPSVSSQQPRTTSSRDPEVTTDQEPSRGRAGALPPLPGSSKTPPKETLAHPTGALLSAEDQKGRVGPRHTSCISRPRPELGTQVGMPGVSVPAYRTLSRSLNFHELQFLYLCPLSIDRSTTYHLSIYLSD